MATIISNIDEMFQQLFEDLHRVDQAAVAATSSSSTVTAGSPWVLISSNSPTGTNVVNFTGLSGYTDIRVVVRAMTFAVADRPKLRVSTDNGGTYLAASGDYIQISGAGAPTNTTELEFMDNNNTTSRNGEILLEGINMTTAPKMSRSNFFNSDGFNLRLMPTTSAVNAVRVFSTQNFTGGTIYVYGRV